MMRQVDLLPESYARRRRERRNIVIVALAGFLVLLILIGYWVVLGSQVNDEKNKLAEARAHNAALQAEIAKLQVFADLEEEVQSKRDALLTVMTGDLNWPAIMTEIAMVIPGEVWLEQMTASAGATEGSAPAPTETNAIPLRANEEGSTGRITFSGSSLSMPAIAKWLIRLGTVDRFDAIWLSNAIEAPGTDNTPSVIDFDSSVELGQKALSNRFSGEELP